MALVVKAVMTGPFQENSYLAGCPVTKKAIFIDPGDEPEKVAALAEQTGMTPIAIVNTHAHLDHVGAAGALQARYQIPFHIHPGERQWLDTLPMQAMMFGLMPRAAPTVDGWLEDGQVLEVGEQRLRVIHTPGHTTGGCCLFFEESRVLFTGDTLFSGGVGRTDFPMGSWEDLERSIKSRLFPLGDEVAFYSGHGPAGRLGQERRHNPYVGEDADR